MTFDPKQFLSDIADFLWKPRLDIWDRYPVGCVVRITSGAFTGNTGIVTSHYKTQAGLKAVSVNRINPSHLDRNYEIDEKDCIIRRVSKTI